MRPELIRQFDIIPEEALKQHIGIIGVGAIGGWACWFLSKMGITDITIYDHDVVSIENMNCQPYRKKDIGKSKVEALKEIIAEFSDTNIYAIPEKYEKQGPIKGIVVSSVDSMAARKTIWEAHKDQLGTKMIIDPRMAVEFAMMFVMNPLDGDDIESYERTLYTDEESIQERCTAKSTVYTAGLIAGLVCKAVKDIILKKDYTRNVQWSIAENQPIFHNASAFKRRKSIEIVIPQNKQPTETSSAISY